MLLHHGLNVSLIVFLVTWKGGLSLSLSVSPASCVEQFLTQIMINIRKIDKI